MKPIALALTPTRNRRLNEVTGMVLMVVASLLMLALASYRPTDPSLNTVAGSLPIHNWTGMVGAAISDLLLQTEGVAAFLFPMLLGAVGWAWVRSQATGSPAAKLGGVLLYLMFAPALFGLIPGHVRWMDAMPVEGLVGRVVGDALVHYLNLPGAAIVIVSMVAIALYLSTTFSFSTAQQWFMIRFAFALAWRDRLRHWYLRWAKARAAKSAARREAMRAKELVTTQTPQKVKTSAKRQEADCTIPRRRAGFAEETKPQAVPGAAYPNPVEPNAVHQYSRRATGRCPVPRWKMKLPTPHRWSLFPSPSRPRPSR